MSQLFNTLSSNPQNIHLPTALTLITTGRHLALFVSCPNVSFLPTTVAKTTTYTILTTQTNTLIFTVLFVRMIPHPSLGDLNNRVSLFVGKPNQRQPLEHSSFQD